MNRKSAFLLLTLLAITTTTSAKDKPSSLNLKSKLSDLKSTIKSNRYVLVLFNVPDTERGQKLTKLLKSLYDNLRLDFSMAYLQLAVKKESKRRYEFFLYIEGNGAHYTGLHNLPQLKNWLTEVRAAAPRKKEKLEEIDNIDSHYFVYAEKNYMTIYKKEVNLLAKLINPLSIIHGLDKEELDKITKDRQPETALWAYREYGDEIIPIIQGKNLKEMAEYISFHELPNSLIPNKASLRLILELKTPVLLYFAKSGKDSFYDEVEEAVAPYKEFLIPVFVDTTKKDKYTKFLVDFMGVKKLPSIRILNMVDKLTRFKFVGKKQIALINNFLTNYIKGNLESYQISEKIKKGQLARGIRKGNFKLFKKILADVGTNYLVLVYSRLVDGIKEHFRVLREVRDALDINIGFKVIAINHDKNDLDGYYNDAVPFFFVASTKNVLHHYEGGLNTEDLIKFVVDELPHLKVKSDPMSSDL